MKNFIILSLIVVFVSSCGLKSRLPRPKNATYKRTYPNK